MSRPDLMPDTDLLPTSPGPAGDPIRAQRQLLEQTARQLLTMRRVMRQVIQQAHTQARLPELAQLGEGQLYLLHHLADTDRLTAGELAARCHVAEPTISKTLNQLEARGLVARATDRSDRRVVHVTLTTAGRALLEAADTRLVASLAETLGPLTAAQLHDLQAAMDHLAGLAVSPDREAKRAR